MYFHLNADRWISSSPSDDNLCDRDTLLYDFPQTADFRGNDGIKLVINIMAEQAKWFEITLFPLKIGRPEYIPQTKARVFVSPGHHHLEVPFSQFDYIKLNEACLKYISHMTVALKECASTDSFKLINAEVCRFGDFFVDAEYTSRMGEAGAKVVYHMWVENRSESRRYVTVSAKDSGRESVLFEYPEGIVLEPSEKKMVEVYAVIPENMPKAGWEKKVLNWTPDGSAGKSIRTVLYVSRAAQHPCMLHTEAEWWKLQKQINDSKDLQQILEREYVSAAETWEVPEPYEEPDYVYDFESKNSLLKTAIAWKLTGRESLKNKLLKYLLGMLDKERGYMSTQWPYFRVVESKEEYRKGNFKVKRACSRLWVHEGEYMSVITYVYDLLYNCPEITPEMHLELEQCLRNYMEFESWRLTEGDGNNFQISEASAALGCACMLQDYEQIERFLVGCNGLYELMGATLSDDGSYFEGASGYMKLVAELLLKTAVICEHYFLNFKDIMVPASFDQNILHSAWALRKNYSEDRKSFLGMSFERFEKIQKPYRCLKDYLDNLRKLLTPKGIIFSVNDSNEQDMISIMEKAYYLYREPAYLEIAKLADTPDLLYGLHMSDKTEELSYESYLNTGNGFAVLRETEGAFTQAVLKFGQHGGYHGHFDRLSLVSFIRNNQTFHNQEYAWYGYFSFLFKMWVQTSMAHNMVVVDGKMQEPSACQNIYFHSGEDFQAVCAQTTTRWCDPPYGGQTPYVLKFPEEKSMAEGRFILPGNRKQGEIGEYSEPIFQRRLLALVDGICLIWDYVEADEEHEYDCMYHPIGKCEAEGLQFLQYQSRFNYDPYGAGQFITDCRRYQGIGCTRLEFNNDIKVARSEDILDFPDRSALYRAYPNIGEVIIGRYPTDTSTFSDNELQPSVDILKDFCKKSISFHSKGKTASFVTALEIGTDTLSIESINCNSVNEIAIKVNGKVIKIRVDGIDVKECMEIKVSLNKY